MQLMSEEDPHVAREKSSTPEDRPVMAPRINPCALLILLMLAGITPAQSQVTKELHKHAPYSPEHIIIKLKSVGTSASLDALHQHFKVRKARSLFTAHRKGAKAMAQKLADELAKVQLLEVPSGTNIEQAVAEYAKDSMVEYAQPDYLMQVESNPERSFFQLGQYVVFKAIWTCGESK